MSPKGEDRVPVYTREQLERKKKQPSLEVKISPVQVERDISACIGEI